MSMRVGKGAGRVCNLSVGNCSPRGVRSLRSKTAGADSYQRGWWREISFRRRYIIIVERFQQTGNRRCFLRGSGQHAEEVV